MKVPISECAVIDLDAPVLHGKLLRKCFPNADRGGRPASIGSPLGPAAPHSDVSTVVDDVEAMKMMRREMRTVDAERVEQGRPVRQATVKTGY